MTSRITKALLGLIALTFLGLQPGRADAFGGHRRAVTAFALPSVPVAAVPVTAAYAPMTPVIVGRPVVVASPIVTSQMVTTPMFSAPVVANFAPQPAMPVTSFYAPTTSFFAPAAPLPSVQAAPATTTFYAPATTSFYAPAAPSFAPVAGVPAAGVTAPGVIVQRPIFFVP